MKKLYIYGIIALAAIVSCNKTEISETSATGEQQEGYGVIYATTEATKTTMAGSGIYERAEWVTGDKLYVFPTASNDFNGIEYTAQNSGGTATFTGTEMNAIVGAIYPSSSAIKCLSGAQNHGPKLQAKILAEQDGSFHNVVFAGLPKESGSKELLFTAVSSVIKITVPAEKKIKMIKLQSNQDICGPFNAECNSKYGNDTWNISNFTTDMGKEINVTAPQGACFSGDVYVAVLPTSSSNSITVSLVSEDRFATISKSIAPFKMNTIEDFGTIKVNIDKSPKAFTIDDTGHQVYIAPGNLQYQASTGTWRFAEHQWDYVGYGQDNNTAGTIYVNEAKSTNDSVKVNYTGWIDYFGFGTSGCDGGPAPYLTTADASLYPNVDLSIKDNYKYDWGRYCDIKSKNTDGTWSLDQYNKKWHTISRAQWVYLFNRPGNKWGTATISSVSVDGTTTKKTIKGTIILPDYFDQPNGVNFTSGNTDKNTYTLEQFNQMAENGAIFLPWAGYRNWGVTGNTQITLIGRYNTIERGKPIDISGSGCTHSGSYTDFGGYLVRLVRDVPAE